MEKTAAVAALTALAQDNRLDVFRLLVRVGRAGMPAGAVAKALALFLSFLAIVLGVWIARFTATIDAGARTAFYRELAKLTERFVGMEAGACRAGAPVRGE